MISELQVRIASARNGISFYENKIKEAEKEMENCIQLKKILAQLSTKALDTYNYLQSAGNNLNMGLKINGVGMGAKVMDRSSSMKSFYSKTEIAISNVQVRIAELEENIAEYKNNITKFNENISYYESEIQRINNKSKKRTTIMGMLRKG